MGACDDTHGFLSDILHLFGRAHKAGVDESAREPIETAPLLPISRRPLVRNFERHPRSAVRFIAPCFRHPADDAIFRSEFQLLGGVG